MRDGHELVRVAKLSARAASMMAATVSDSRMPVPPVGVLMRTRSPGEEQPGGRSVEREAVGRREDDVVGPASPRLSCRGGIDDVRQGLDSAEQPGCVDEGVGGVAATQSDRGDGPRRTAGGRFWRASAPGG